jgi:hypothetical protein
MNPKNKIEKYLLLCFSFLFTVTSLRADDLSGVLSSIAIAKEEAKAKSALYDGFKNPPDSARPLVRWAWDAKCPTEKEINRQLDTFKQAGFGGVEICPGALTDEIAKILKVAADAAKKRGLLVDLALGQALSLPNLQFGEQLQIIALGKKPLKGPMSFRGEMKDLIKLADVTQNIQEDPNCRVIFLRLVPMGLLSFAQGEEFVKKISPDGSIAFDINDSNDYVLYIGAWHENFIKPASPSGGLLDPFNKQAVEKYLNNISSLLNPALGGSLGNFIHAVSCDGIDLHGANWTMDLSQEFFNRRGYNVVPYLPLILDFNLPSEKTRFYDTTRRVRYDYCLTLAQLYHERFVETFHNWCRDNGVLSRLGPPAYPMLLDMFDDFNVPDVPAGDAPAINKIASSAARYAGKSIVSCQSFSPYDDLSFISGANQSIFNAPGKNTCDRSARLSYLFRNSRQQSRIAILLPANDIWSDCGPSRGRLDDYMWYLFPLWQALNNNGYTADYINEKIVQQTTYEDGKLHIGSLAYDAIIIPDSFSVEFETTRILRFFAKAGGKIIFVGRTPQTAPGFNDLVKRSVPVSITMDYIRQNDPNVVVFIPAPVRDKDNLVSWSAGLMKKNNVAPQVKISPVNPDLFFVHYLADGRDIFFFTNTKKDSITFSAQFDAAGNTPSVWDPETGKRGNFPYGDKKGTLDITLQPLKSILLVFDKTKNS